MVAGTETNLRPVEIEDDADREPIIEVIESHITRMLVTKYRPHCDLRGLPRTERVGLDGSDDLAVDVWLTVETVGDKLYVIATAYGCRLWDVTKARHFRGDFTVTREQQLSVERRALVNL
jgi:hypothetical protein